VKPSSRMVRNISLGIGGAYLLAAGIVLSLNASRVLLLYLAIAGVLVIASVLVQRDTSRPKDRADRGYWQMTGERFRDPASGRTMEVRRNPITGERDYVEVDG
jgi:hypothetical protein